MKMKDRGKKKKKKETCCSLCTAAHDPGTGRNRMNLWWRAAAATGPEKGHVFIDTFTFLLSLSI